MAAVLSLWAGLAFGHASGFHKRTVLTVAPQKLEALITLDVDGGTRAKLLRAGADLDRTGQLSKQEREALRNKLAGLARRPLKVSVAGYPASFELVESKIDLRGNFGRGEDGVSVALLLEARLPEKISPGMKLALEDASPDSSHVAVQVHQSSADGGSEVASMELLPGARLEVRLNGQ